ncbi:molybdopterin synthase [Salinigranum salinum]|uniref:molybdopterin synthase n=1 Tax=Salinigranum salinum TaxID=1364937 RepID=UPI00126086F3|nr:molybdopterin synthase [Salinigranum salinum]
MRVFGIAGTGAGDLAARLTPRLDGPVVVVESVETVDHDGTADTYRLADESWNAAGTGRSLGAVLDDVAPRYAYAICLGFADVDVPTVALGDVDVPESLVAAASADEVDLDAVLDALGGVEPHVTLGTLVARIKASPRADRAGAIATFTGRVRAKDGDDDPRTTALEFEKYEGVAEERMATICRELEAREGVLDVEMHHRTGVIPDGDDIVFVVVLAGHREEAFRTVEDGINRLKDEVPLFKKEVTVEDTFWRHER